MMPATENEARDLWARQLLRSMFKAAVDRADPATVLAAHLPERPTGRCIVVGAGKAAGSMAAAVEAAWPDMPLSGVVVVPYGHGAPTHRIRVLEAAHPVPDSNSEAAAREILTAVGGLAEEDLVLALISGGGSSVMALPADGVTLEDKRTVNRLLLRSGLDIRTMNAVRRRLSAIKGGKLAAAAAPARVVTLCVSDIPGDHLAAIASGPTALDADGEPDLRRILAALGPDVPPAAARLLAQPPPPALATGPDDIRAIATPRWALNAAAAVAQAAGFRVRILGDDIEGESRDVARGMADLVRHGRLEPTAFISGGETTVTLSGPSTGRGGRNTEFLLALMAELGPRDRVWALAADTDGEDGASGGAAGALAGPDTLARARASGLDPLAYLAAHDSGGFFERLGELVVTGPTRTNVNDFRAILVLPDGWPAARPRRLEPSPDHNTSEQRT
jgi:glycerate 2-kinase